MQEESLQFIGKSTKRVKGVCAPTGSGKEGFAIASCLISKQPTAIVTDSRALQDSYMSLHAHRGMVDLRGRSNYQCEMHADDPDYTCEQGYAARCPYKGSNQCASSFAEMRANASWLVVTNYDKWIHSRKSGVGLSHITRVVFDECHEAANALARAMQIKLHSREIEDVLKYRFPSPDEAQFFTTWKPWASLARLRCERLMLKTRDLIGGARTPKPGMVKQYTNLRGLGRRLAVLATAAIDNWVVEEMHNGYIFDPIQPARYAESSLLLGVPDIVAMSATLRPKHLWMMGIGSANFDFQEFPSDFDADRCPIYYIPTMQVDSRAGDLAPLWNRIDQILAPRRDRNRLMHTISYSRKEEVVTRLRAAQEAKDEGKLFYTERGEPATETIQEFVDAYPGALLVSPSVGQGFDFKFKACEVQIICKVPFPPPSKVMKARTEQDPEYPHHIAAQKLVQLAGRIMRDKKDRGETFICDDHLAWFAPKYSYLFPKSFAQFLKRVSVIPPAPPRLV